MTLKEPLLTISFAACPAISGLPAGNCKLTVVILRDMNRGYRLEHFLTFRQVILTFTGGN